MTTYLESIILGVVQGLTEFLPVSSSGHLVLAQHLFGVKEGALLLDTLLHVASVLAVVYVFRRDIAELLQQAFGRKGMEKKSAWRYILWLIIGSVPAGIAGILFKDFFESLFSNTQAVGFSLLFTAALLFLTAARKKEGGTISLWQAVGIGLAQAVAILPGVSRSGSTIAIALLLGVARTEAGKFSFFLALPAIIGAAVLQLKDCAFASVAWGPIFAGFLASCIVSILALKLLLWVIRGGKLYYFGFYCAVIGLLSIIFLH
jgi:undecaprenyl-diphosphatase